MTGAFAAPDGRRSFLNAHPWLPPLLLVVLSFAVHLPQWVLPTHSDPLWLFGSTAWGDHPGWLPGHNYLDPYIAFTTQSLGRLVAQDWLHGIVPWWNPYVGIGVPLAGQMQPSVFLLPFVLLLALPGGVVWLTISMQILAALGTYALLRELRRSRLAALVGGGLYGLNGTIAWVPGPAAVFCTLAFLPVLLWGIERARRPEQGAAAMLGIAVGIGGSLVAGFPETAYIDGLMGLAWAGLRCSSGPFGTLVARRVIAGGVLGLLLASPVLIAFADEMVGSRLAAQHLFGPVSLKLRAFPLIFIPLVFGPINSGSAVANIGATWGDVGGYSSVLIAMMALLSFSDSGPDRSLRWMLGMLVTAFLAKTYGFVPAMMLFNVLPGMKQVAFYRYSAPAWELALTVLAANGMDVLVPGIRRPAGLACLGAAAVAILSLTLAARADAMHSSSLSVATMTRILVVAAVCTFGLLGIAYMVTVHHPAISRRVIAVLMIGEAATMFCLPQAAGSVGGKLDQGSATFLQDHAGLGRVMTLGPISPNYGAYFGFGMVNHNMTPVPQLWLDHIDRTLLPGFLGLDGSGATFWPVGPRPPGDARTAIRMINGHRADYEAIGVRYLITPKQLSPLRATVASMPDSGSRALALAPGDTADISLPAPALPRPVVEVGIMIGTYGGRSDGNLAVRLCDGGMCRSGAAAIAGFADNGIAYVPLDGPLTVFARDTLALRVAHVGGRSTVAIWTWPAPMAARTGASALEDARVIAAPGLGAQAVPDLGLRLQQKLDWRLVFAGRTSDVWEMPNPLNYFDADGCRLHFSDRESVQADCVKPSVLIRRELFLAGWNARLDGAPIAVAANRTVLQQVALPAGHHVVTFAFVPPYMSVGWTLLGIATVMIIWLTAEAFRRRQGSAPA